MIRFALIWFEPGVVDYLNGYPAFKTVGASTINTGFYKNYIRYLAYFVDSRYITDISDESIKRRVEESIAKTGFSLAEFTEYIKPVVQVVWPQGNPLYHGKVTMEMAEKFLQFIEPLWCEYNGIRSTGYIKNNDVILDDDDELFDI